MLKVGGSGSTISVETLGANLLLDAGCGGQISSFTVKDELFSHPLLDGKRVLPGLVFIVGGRRVSLAEGRAKMEITAQKSDHVKITAVTALCDGALQVSQEYEIHEEGVLFCNLAVEIPGGQRVELSDCSLNLSVETASCKVACWGHYLRELSWKQDYSTVHALTGFQMHRKPEETVDRRELFPFISIDLGWEATRFFSNHVEFLLEDWTAFDYGEQQQTRTRVGAEDGCWQAHWHFLDGRTLSVSGPHRYRNRWGIAWGRARTHSGAAADPAVRNNCLGARICHLMYPYAREGDRWPWVSMPIKQVAVQEPQLFAGNPELARADEAREAGASLVILHQFWMSNPGSNNEPAADYRPFDPDWLRAFTGRCHELGMRVAYYIRGTERWLMYSPFFEDFLERDRDGAYADWNTPFHMGYVKCSPLHVSMHDHFHFTKALRTRVGPGGILTGHTNNANLVQSACFDAGVGGEVSVRHDELLENPISTAYYSQLDGQGAHIISGNLPDREAFSSPKATAVCAAFGIASHPFMEPNITFAERVAFIKPLWDALNRLPGNIVRLHNPAYSPTRAVSTEAETIYPHIWQSDAGQALLLATNLSGQPGSGTVEIDVSEMDVPAGATPQVLDIDGTFTQARVDGSAVHVEDVPPQGFAALLIG